MSGKVNDKKWRLATGWGRAGGFLREILVLVIGIMISFLINDYRQNRQYSKEEATVILQLYEDLRLDTALIAQGLKEIKIVEEAFNDYVNAESIEDSVGLQEFTRSMYGFLNVFTFNPNRTAYMQLTVQSKLDRVQDRALLSKVMRLYEEDYQNVKFIIEFHSEYFSNTLSDLLFDALPFTERGLQPTDYEGINAFIHDRATGNRLEFAYILILNMRVVYQKVQREVESILNYIESNYKDRLT